MNNEKSIAGARELLDALADMVAVYGEAETHAIALVDALSRADVTAVERATAVKAEALRAAEIIEQRRRAAEDAVRHALSAGPDAGEAEVITVSRLLAVLPPDEAEELRGLRHELLALLVRLQIKGREASLLARTAHGVVARVARAGMPQAIGYGPRGEQTRFYGAGRLAGRLA